MSDDKVTVEQTPEDHEKTIQALNLMATLERLGLLEVALDCVKLLDGHGREIDRAEICGKAIRHAESATSFMKTFHIDRDSGQHHALHAATRFLMIAAIDKAAL